MNKPPLESRIEKDFLKGLKRIPCTLKVRKINGMGYRSWPDRMILGPKKFIMFIELKRPKLGRVSPGQLDLFQDMKELGHNVPIFTDGKQAADFVLDALIKHGALKC